MRKRFAALLGFLLFASLDTIAASAGLETSVERAQAMLIREDLGEGIYLFRAPSDLDYWTATNSVVIINDDDVLVFDSCTRAVTARAVIAEIRKLTAKPVRTLINSHWHQDHWSGNSEYAKAFPGIRIVSTAQTRDFMAHMRPEFFVQEMYDFGLTRMEEGLANAIATGNLADGSPLTALARAGMEHGISLAKQFVAEIEANPRVLPNMVFQDESTLWSGRREMRLMNFTGDATASTVLYLPGEKVVVTGDVLVSPEDGSGPPPWSTNSHSVSSWLDGLRRLDSMDVRAIVPGQGPVMHDKAYLRRTIELFDAIRRQVLAALDRGHVKFADVRASVNVDDIAQTFAGKDKIDKDFNLVVDLLVKRIMQESLDQSASLE